MISPTLKVFALLFLALSLAAPTLSAVASSYPLGIPTNNGLRYALVSAQGELLHPPTLTQIARFYTLDEKRRLARFQAENGGYGFLNEKGEVLVEPTLQDVRAFTDMGLARAKQNDKWGFISTRGDWVIKPKYDKVSPMEHGYAIAELGSKQFLINPADEPAFKKRYRRIQNVSANGMAAFSNKEKGEWGLINTKGDVVKKPSFTFVGEFNQNNRAPAAIGEGYDWTWGIIDAAGDWVVEPKYNNMPHSFTDDRIVVSDRDYDNFLITDEGDYLIDSPQQNLRISSACKVAWSGYTSFEFYDWQGKGISNLNKPNYSWFNVFKDDCQGLAFSGQHWGWLSVDGVFRSFPDDVIEPVVDYRENITGLWSEIVPVITAKRKLAYLDSSAEVIFTTAVTKEKNKDVFILKTATGEKLWQADFESGALRDKHNYFFARQAQEFGFDPAWLSDSQSLVDELKQSTTRYFDPWSPDPYQIDSGDLSDLPLGAAKTLAYDYLSETAWGSYYFMGETIDFSDLYESTKTALSQSLGKPEKFSDTLRDELYEAGAPGGDSGITEKNVAVWRVADQILMLGGFAAYGDGDITQILSLLLLPSIDNSTINQPLNINIETITTADESDDDIADMVKALSTVTDDPVRTQQQANKVLSAIREGAEISEYDYLWTLYALLTAAYPEMDGGMDQQSYINVADTAIAYLEKNGVGTWVFTDFGQFQMEVYRRAGNGVAWTLRESDPNTALSYIEQALTHARDEDLWMYDTQVRVLLNLGRRDQAYAIVDTVLSNNPDFKDFQDFLRDKEFTNWRKRIK